MARDNKNLDYDELPVDSPVRKRLPLLLRRAWYGLNQAFRRNIAHAGATPDQFTVLRTLNEHPEGLTQSKLAKLMTSDPNTIASLLERMRATGWVDRKKHETDKRANLIRLKPAGEKKFAQLRDIAADLQLFLLEKLPLVQREAFLEQLADLADACQDAAEDAARDRDRA